MAGLDPLAAAAAQVASAQAAIDEATLSLGANIPVLQAQVSVGDVVSAMVLPPQNGTDLLSFLGQTVPAQLPPGINPGESLLLQVTAFTNTAVIVKNLGMLDPQNPIPIVNVQLPPAEPGAPQTATLTTQLPGSQSSPPAAAAGNTPAPLPQIPPGIAPSRAVFIEAVVRAAPQATPSGNAAPSPRAPVSAAQTPAPLDSDVEARIALSRATSIAPGLRQAPIPARIPAAPPILDTPGARAAALQSSASALARALPQTASPPPASAPIAPAVPDTPEGALLARLGVPITPATLAAARSIDNATASLTGAFEKLDTLLANLPQAQIPGALRSMLGFVSRMDLRNTGALAEQISSFVNDVVDGAEAKIADMVEQWLSLAPETPEATNVSPPLPGAPATATTPPGAAATPAQATSVAAQAAERSVALQFDPKAAMQQMLAAQPAGAQPALVSALQDALGATTAVQLGTLAANAEDPSTLTLVLPAYFYPGGAPTQLRISRDTADAKKALDADNFHIAFVLDTQSLGTVAIDVQTVGRAVSVDVKTERTTAADRFKASFGDLRGRLEKLRYRVANIGAGVAAPLSARSQKETPPETPRSRFSIWDSKA